MSTFSVVPHLTIKIDGADLNAETLQTIETIYVKQILSMPSQCEILIPEAHASVSTEIHTKVGSLIQLNVKEHDKSLFYGQITAVEFIYDAAKTPTLCIRAYDLLHQLRKRQPVRTHSHVNLNQLARDLTQDMGFTVQGGEATPSIPRLFQYNQSDLQLLHEFGESCGHYFFLNAKQLQITTLGEGVGNELLTLGENLLEVRFSINAETVTGSVTATGWNMQRSTPHIRKVQEPELVTNSKIRVESSGFSTDGQRTLVDHNIQDDNQAEMVAQKALDRSIVQQVTLWGVTEGNPVLTPGSSVNIAGVAMHLEGQYILTEVTHIIDPVKGFISEIKTTPPLIEKSKARKNATIGVVSQVDDPESLGRIKVILPTYNDIETEWLEVVSLGAGANKGQLILPDIDDNVLLLFVNGEIAQAVVLGGVYGENELPYPVIDEGRVKRYVTQTAGNQRIYLDDGEVSIKIETQTGHNISIKPELISISHNNGSFVEISESLMTIHSETSLEIEAPGNSIIFRGKKIDFEQA